tara:strand:- start:11746 stop:12903 length:1158 start_codon:yes stop_codon:yes gene_type:complete
MITNTRKIRLTFIIVSFQTGGAEIMLLRLLKHINRNIFDVSIIGLIDKGPIKKQIRDLSFPVYVAFKNYNYLFGTINLIKIIKRIKPDIVNTWMYHPDFLGGIASRIAKVPLLVWMIHQSNFILSKNNWPTYFIMRICSSLSKLMPDKILSVSKRAAKQHIIYGYDQRKLYVIPPIVDTDNFIKNKTAKKRLCNELNIDMNSILIGLFGRFHPQKNHKTLIEAATIVNEIYPNTHFIFSGRDITYNNIVLSKLIENSNANKFIHLLGFRKNIVDLYSSLDLYVSASSFGEAFPLVLCEAMASEVPCVATDVGDSKYIIGNTGRIVQPNSVNQLAEGIIGLIELGNKELKRKGKISRKRIIDNFQAEMIVLKYESFFSEIFNKNHH